MFEKLIELFGGGGDAGAENLEGSYLKHLLQEVRPRVREELEREPNHEPLWLVAAEVFRASSGDPLEERPYDGPIANPNEHGSWPTDETAPPPPPLEQDDIATDDTQEFERPDSPEQPPDEDMEVVDPDDETDELEEEVVERVDESEPEEVVTDPAGPPPAPAGGDPDEVAELSTTELNNAAARHADEAQIDSPEMLRTARVFLGMLVDNSRLPAGLRMNVDDIQRVRTLLLGYFLGKQDVEMRANELLGVVESKFSEGYYSQARMLTELFGAHRETRLENDRNLFLREMNLKAMGGRAPHQGVDIRDELPEKLRAINEAEDAGFSPFFDWYSEATGIDFNVCARRSDEVEAWRKALAPASDDDKKEICLNIVPPRQWDLPSEFDESLPALIHDQMDAQKALDAVDNYLRLVYFTLRAVGDTGLESFLPRFFDWSEQVAGVDSVRFLPTLHREIAEGDRLVVDIFDDMCRQHYAEPVRALIEDVDEERIHEALEGVVEKLQDVELDALAPAYYDLTGFVADELLRMELPEPEFHFKLHRLT